MTADSDYPPGWYPDPSDGRRWRWWDGSAWTPYGAAGDGSSQASASFSEVQALLAREQRMVRWVRVALVVAGVGNLTIDALIAAQAAKIDRFYRNLFHGQVQAVPSPFLWVELVGLGASAATIVYFVWQYRSAVVARALGYRARYSPGLGVGFWFVPLASFWVPSRVLADLLPTNAERRRRLVPRAWIAYLAAGLLDSGAMFTVVLGERAAGLVLFGASLVIFGAIYGITWRWIGSVGVTHEEGLAGLSGQRS